MPFVNLHLTNGMYTLILQIPKETTRRDWNSRQAEATPVLEVLTWQLRF